jgi:NitT/TauT family transport system substrate-binding protein
VSKRPAGGFDKWLFRKAGQDGDYYHDENMRPDLQALQANIDLQHQLGLVKASINVPKHADLSIVEEAAKRIR